MTIVIDDNSHAYTTTVKKLKSRHMKLDILSELPLALIFISAPAKVHLICGTHLTQISVKAFANTDEFCCHSSLCAELWPNPT